MFAAGAAGWISTSTWGAASAGGATGTITTLGLEAARGEAAEALFFMQMAIIHRVMAIPVKIDPVTINGVNEGRVGSVGCSQLERAARSAFAVQVICVVFPFTTLVIGKAVLQPLSTNHLTMSGESIHVRGMHIDCSG